jgi:hypothetical protein
VSLLCLISPYSEPVHNSTYDELGKIIRSCESMSIGKDVVAAAAKFDYL